MFEDQNQKTIPVNNNHFLGQPQNPFVPASAPAPSPSSSATNQQVKAMPEDMFSETEPPVARTYQSTASSRNYNQNYPNAGQVPITGSSPMAYDQDLFGRRGFPWPKVITIFIIIIVLLVGIGAVYGGYVYFKSLNQTPNTPAINNNQPASDADNLITPPPVENQAPVINGTNTLPTTEEIKDLDGDGLTDEEEIALNTKKDQVDTDVDGLTDWAEVKIYKTDPLNPDTDGDGYKDGQEVINGYDPLRPGNARLYDIPTGSTGNQ